MLLIYDGQCAPDASTIRMGGIPLVPVGFEWPTCRTCDGAMQFLAHLPLEVATISVFFCQNDPGMCDDWDATSGGNRAYLFSDALEPAVVPSNGATLPGAATGLRRHPEHVPTQAPMLGRIGGEPDWIQSNEAPPCSVCNAPMAFTAELEEGHDHRTAVSFGGGGRGYVFRCDHCRRAAFLWQC